MCGRFTLHASPEAVAKQFELPETPDLSTRYNIAPTQPVAVVRVDRQREERVLEMMRWGLIPSWAKDASIGSKLINARSESVAEKPAFRSAFKKRRCLIVADGFYEWQPVPGKKQKQPFFFGMRDEQPFAFAGLWERWTDPGGERVDSCTIVTAPANTLVATVHDRMPVILSPESYDLWLDPMLEDAPRLQALLLPFQPERMRAYPVSTQVNSPGNDSAECIAPMASAV